MSLILTHDFSIFHCQLLNETNKFMRRITPSLILLLLSLNFISQAQYVFDSKKAEKLYQTLESYYDAYEYGKILKNESDMLAMFESKQDTLSALVYSFLAESYLMWNDDVAKSLEYYLKEMELRKKIQPKEDHKNLAFNIATLYDEAGQYEKSEGLLLGILASDEKEFGKRSDEYFMTASALLDHYINTYKIKEGLALADDAKRSVKKGTYNEALLLRAYAELYTQTGEFKKAEKNITTALALLEETGYYPSLEYVYFLNTLSFIYTDMGKLSQVEEILNRALSILSRLQGDFEEDEMSIKSNLAQLYIDLGNHPRAEELLIEVMNFDKEYYGEKSFTYGVSNQSLGNNSFFAEDYSKAEAYLLKAKDVYEKTVGTKNINYARTLNTLASIYSIQGNYTKAQEIGNASIAAHKASVGENNPEYAWPMQVMGTLYQRMGDLDKALEYHDNSLRIRSKLLGNTHPNYARNTRLLAVLHWKRANMDKALAYYNETFDNYFAQINAFFPVLSEDDKSKFYYNNLKPTFEQFNSFIIENRSTDKQLIGQMYNYQLATKGLILYATSKVRESILNSGDSLLIEKYETWISQKEMLAQLFSASDLDPDIRSKKVDSLKLASNKLEAELSKLSSVFSSNFASKDLTWQDIKAKLKPGEAAVEIIRFRAFNPDKAGYFTDEVYYVGLIVTTETIDAPEMVIMRNGKEMEARYLANYRNAVKYRVAENHSYRLFWRPLANKLQGIKKIYFSPDGVYNQISIYTLQNPDTKKYTIDEFEIKLVTNTKDLVAWADKPKPASVGSSYLFGFPNYNMGVVDEEIKKGEKTIDEVMGAAEGRGASRGARGARGGEQESEMDIEEFNRSLPRGIRGNLMRYMRSNALLALLPGTQKEVNLIEDLHKNQNFETVKFMSNAAVEERIKEVKNPKTLHIATHGFFLEHEESEDGTSDKYVSNPLLRSGLIMAGANSFISSGEIGADIKLKDDGILTAYEAMNLYLDDTELVVLSACETGLGEVKNGEGVFGLQRAFQIAGAKSIIMSMWTVDDDATQELMTIFYREWLKTGDKNYAFVTAQKELKAKWIYPYYWGAFVMIGN